MAAEPIAKDGGTWYLAQAADGAWRLFARDQSESARARVLLELAGYPAVITPGGNLFHLGASLRRVAAMRRH